MKTLVIGALLTTLCLSAQAVTRPELDQRLQKLSLKFEQMQNNPATRIPANLLQKACGIVLLQTSRGGFIFGYQGGYGVLMVKEPQSDQWSPPVFLSANKGTFGAQIGGQTSFQAILLMDTNAIPLLTGSQFNFGAQAQGTAGNMSDTEQSKSSPLQQMTLVFTDAQGLYGGAVVTGGGLAPDTNDNAVYYGQYVTPSQVLFGNQVRPTEAAGYLAQKLNQYSK
jgi:SH3 domain-containing YSC84-like protein 1